MAEETLGVIGAAMAETGVEIIGGVEIDGIELTPWDKLLEVVSRGV